MTSDDADDLLVSLRWRGVGEGHWCEMKMSSWFWIARKQNAQTHGFNTDGCIKNDLDRESGAYCLPSCPVFSCDERERRTMRNRKRSCCYLQFRRMTRISWESDISSYKYTSYGNMSFEGKAQRLRMTGWEDPIDVAIVTQSRSCLWLYRRCARYQHL